MTAIRVSQETLNEAVAFINPMERMMMMLDDLAFSETRVMNEQTYIEMGKALMEINELKNEVKQTIIYRNAVRQAAAQVMNPRLSAAEMAADIENYTCCPACKSYMTKRHFKEKHIKTKKCSHILQLRSFNAIKGTGEIKNKTLRARRQKKEAGHLQDVEAVIVCLAETPIKRKLSTNEESDEYEFERRVQIPTDYHDGTGDIAYQGEFWIKNEDGGWVIENEIVVEEEVKVVEVVKKIKKKRVKKMNVIKE